MQALEEKRINYEKKLRQMPIKTLTVQMEMDSAHGLEPFNSPGYREVISRGQSIGGELKSVLTKDDRSSLLTLLRQEGRFGYLLTLNTQFPVNVMIDAFKISNCFNTWGLPGYYREDAAEAIIARRKKQSTRWKPCLMMNNPLRCSIRGRHDL